MTPRQRAELLGACGRGKVRRAPNGAIIREHDQAHGFPVRVDRHIKMLLAEGAVYLDDHNLYRPTDA